MSREVLNVLFIAGTGRSGSTLLSQLLAQIDGLFHVGELRQMWKKGFGQNMPCECGQGFRQCEFWTQVVADVFGDINDTEVQRIESLRRSAEHCFSRAGQIQRAMRGDMPDNADVREYAYIISRLHHAISRISGARVVVDSSKRPPHGMILHLIDTIEDYPIHLVRDSRAVVYSFLRKEYSHGELLRKPPAERIERIGALAGARIWRRENAAAAALRAGCEHGMLMQYEQLVASPDQSLLKVMKLLGQPAPNLSFLVDDGFEMRMGHSLSGNPMRFCHGKMQIRLDAEWRRKLSRLDRWIVTAMTRGMMREFGYEQ